MMQVLDPETLSLSGTAVVEASAGTGKTYTITSLFLRLLLENELGVDQILVVTYTRAATAELRAALPSCQVVICTTFGRPGYFARAMENGASGSSTNEGKLCPRSTFPSPKPNAAFSLL